MLVSKSSQLMEVRGFESLYKTHLFLVFFLCENDESVTKQQPDHNRLAAGVLSLMRDKYPRHEPGGGGDETFKLLMP